MNNKIRASPAAEWGEVGDDPGHADRADLLFAFSEPGVWQKSAAEPPSEKLVFGNYLALGWLHSSPGSRQDESDKETRAKLPARRTAPESPRPAAKPGGPLSVVFSPPQA